MFKLLVNKNLYKVALQGQSGLLKNFRLICSLLKWKLYQGKGYWTPKFFLEVKFFNSTQASWHSKHFLFCFKQCAVLSLTGLWQDLASNIWISPGAAVRENKLKFPLNFSETNLQSNQARVQLHHYSQLWAPVIANDRRRRSGTFDKKTLEGLLKWLGASGWNGTCKRAHISF